MMMKKRFFLKTSLVALAMSSSVYAQKTDAAVNTRGMVKLEDVAEARKKVFAEYAAEAKKARNEENFLMPQLVEKGLKVKTANYKIDDLNLMPYAVLQRGKKMPEGGWPLYIAMHGGGMDTSAKGPHAGRTNTGEWHGQMNFSANRYPDKAIYFVPRMVNDAHGRWWKTYNVTAFDAMIKHAILHWKVNPNKVYMLGISEGGYGTEVLSCLIPDKFAAADGMACGSGTSIHVENLRNLPSRTDVGERDTAYGRIKKAISKHEKIEEYRKKDPKGYVNVLAVQKGRGHGIDYKVGPAWLPQFTRNPHPAKVVYTMFKTDDLKTSGAYWLQARNDLEKKDIYLTGEMNKAANSITVSAKATKADAKYQAPDWQQALAEAGELVPAKGLKLRLWLHESQLDLSKPISLNINGVKSKVTANLNEKAMKESVHKFGDPNYIYPSYIDVEVK